MTETLTTNRKQQRDILAIMADGRWHDVAEIGRKCPTNDARKRLSELLSLGWALENRYRTHKTGIRSKDWRRTDIDERIRASISVSLESARLDIARGVAGGRYVVDVFGRPVISVPYADIEDDIGAVAELAFEAYVDRWSK